MILGYTNYVLFIHMNGQSPRFVLSELMETLSSSF